MSNVISFNDCYNKYLLLKDKYGIDCDKNCDYNEANKLWRKLALKYHPDKTGGDDTIFKEINDLKNNVISGKCTQNYGIILNKTKKDKKKQKEKEEKDYTELVKEAIREKEKYKKDYMNKTDKELLSLLCNKNNNRIAEIIYSYLSEPVKELINKYIIGILKRKIKGNFFSAADMNSFTFFDKIIKSKKV